MSSSRFVRGLISSLLVLALSVIALADTVRLKDGSVLKGKIVSFDAGKFVVVMGEGSRKRELTFLASEVQSITFEEPVPASVSNPTRTAVYDAPAKVQTPTIPAKVVVGGNDAGRPSDAQMKPIEWRIKVLGDNTSNGWTNTGWVVKKGQRIRIEGDGKISIGRGSSTSPSGVPEIEDQQKLLKNVATGALIAVIGDDNNDFIYIGASREFTATRDGALFLGINEGYLDDNSGAFNVKVSIIPDGQ